MDKNSVQNVKLPDNVAAALYADYGGEVNLEILKNFKLNIGQVLNLTKLITSIFKKEIAVAQIEAALVKNVEMAKGETALMAKEICGKRLLIVDTDWFDGEVAKKLVALGADPNEYADFIKQYQKVITEEKQAQEEADLKERQENEEDNYIENKLAEAPSVITDPEAEKRSAKEGFSNYIKGMLMSNDFALKIELNVRLITLMLNDDSQQFHHELLEALYNNNEVLTTKSIVSEEEKLDPTVGNWLKDYIHFAGVDEVTSSIKKAQYFTTSENIKALTPDERILIDKLFDFYIALKNFYENVKKYELDEVYIFPFSEEEQTAFLKTIEREQVEEEAGGNNNDVAPQKMLSIEDLYKGKLEDSKQIYAEKEKIVVSTRKEIDKVADVFEDYLLKRKRYGIIACLEILVETGALDNLITKDVRFKDLLFGYFKRNNLQAEGKLFEANPYQAKYIQYFLKYIFLERLGLPENEGARVAANLSSIFRTKGKEDYAMIAYLDLSDNTFKWS